MRTLLDHHRAHRFVVAGDHPRFIGAAGGHQLCIEFREIPGFRERHPVVSPEIAGLALDAAFFVWFSRWTARASNCDNNEVART
jgi:hypothetical protein